MEPQKTHDATLPQQDLSVRAPLGPRVAVYEAVDNATAGVLQPPGVSANTRGEFTRLEAFNLLKNLAKAEGGKFRPIDVDFTKRTVAILRALNMPLPYYE